MNKIKNLWFNFLSLFRSSKGDIEFKTAYFYVDLSKFKSEKEKENYTNVIKSELKNSVSNQVKKHIEIVEEEIPLLNQIRLLAKIVIKNK